MSSLSDELVKLSELFRGGILTEAEFKAAKEATIQRHAMPPNAESNASSGNTNDAACGTHPAAGVPSPPHVDVSGFETDNPMHASARAAAYDTLETILHNLQQFPAEPRYRRLRCSNPTLRARLLCVPGAIRFLRSIGFTDALSECGEVEGGVGPCLLLPHHLSRGMGEAWRAALDSLRQREAAGRGDADSASRLRRRCAWGVRRERCARAVAAGELRAFLTREFCTDDAGDGLDGAVANLETLRAALQRRRDAPEEAKCRRLRLRHPAVQQRGGLELLVGGAAAEWLEEAEGEAALVLLSEDGVRAGLEIATEVLGALRAEREERRRRAYETAAAAMRAEVRRTRQAEAAATRTPQAMEPTPTHGTARRRIPVAEAVKILLGKGKEEYGGDHTSHNGGRRVGNGEDESEKTA